MINYMWQNKKGLLEKSKCLRCGKLWKQSLELNRTTKLEDFLRLSNNTSAKCCKNSSMFNYILDLNHHRTAVTRDERWPRPKEKGRFKTTNNNTWHGTKDRTGSSSREGEKHKPPWIKLHLKMLLASIYVPLLEYLEYKSLYACWETKDIPFSWNFHFPECG